MDFVVPADHVMKIKENNIDKYLDLAKELKKLWNMIVIPVIISALGTVRKGLEERL